MNELSDLNALREQLKGEVRRLEQMINSERELRTLLASEQVRALDKAEDALSRRLDAMNEIREQLSTQAQTFLPRETFDETRNSWEVWRARVDSEFAQMHGRGVGFETLSNTVFKVIPIVVAIIATGFAIYFGTR